MRYSQVEIAVRKFSAQRSELRKLENRVEKLERKLKQLSRALA
jgi:polyhydroxyalkanoate synthesis regulator phasin